MTEHRCIHCHEEINPQGSVYLVNPGKGWELVHVECFPDYLVQSAERRLVKVEVGNGIDS